MPEINKISHGLTIGDLKYGNARPGVVEATLKPGETMEQALDELDERLNAWHRLRYPHLYQEPNTLLQEIRNEPPPIQQVENREKAKGDIKASMEDCITLEQLKEYKLLASTDKDLQSIYMNRLKELTK